jgi:hypothetical protein
MRTTRSDHTATAFGGHTGAEAMTTFTHKFTRLIGPLHGETPDFDGLDRNWTLTGKKPERT